MNTSDSGQRVLLLLGLLLAVHLTLVLSIILQTSPVIWPLHNDTIHRAGPAADFYSIYNAALNLRHGVDPYSGSPDGVTPYKFPFRYLPAVAMVFQPFTLLPPRAAWVVWIVVLEVLLGLLVFTLWRLMARPCVRIATIGALLVSSPYFLELYMGQFTFAAVTLCCLGLLRPALKSAYWASTLLKPFTLAAAPALVTQPRYRWHVVWAIAGILATSIPYFAYHPDQWSTFFQANFNPQGGMDTGNYGFLRFLRLVVDHLGLQALSTHWAIGIRALRYVLLSGTALLVLHSTCRSLVTGVTALLLAHFLTYPHVWEHHMSAVCILGALLVWDRDSNGLPTRLTCSSLWLLALPSPYGLFDTDKNPAVWDPSGSWPSYGPYLVVLSKVVPCVLLYLQAMRQLPATGLLTSRQALRRLVSTGS